MRPRLFAPSLLVTALLLALPSQAVVDELVTRARAAMAQGQTQQAFDMLSAQEPTRAGDPDFDLVMGMAANAVSQFPRAILALERIVAVQPDNSQARGELGRALFGVGDRAGARALLSESKLAGVPLVAGETIDQLLQAVDRVEALGLSSYRGFVEFAIGDDTNANAGPSARNLAVPAFGGALISVQPAGVNTDALFMNTSAGFSGRYVLGDPRWSLIGNVYGASRLHNTAGRPFDFNQIDANGGVSYRVDRNEYTLVGQWGGYEIDHDRVRNSTGVVAEWTFRFDGFTQASLYGQLGRLSYPQQPVSNADRNVIGMTYAQMSRAGTFGYGGFYLGRESARTTGFAHLGHRLIGWRVGLQQPVVPNLAVFTTFAYEKREFGGQDPLFLTQRVDSQFNLSLGLSWVPAPLWRVTPQVAWVNTDSNVPLADYSRRTVSVAVRREF